MSIQVNEYNEYDYNQQNASQNSVQNQNAEEEFVFGSNNDNTTNPFNSSKENDNIWSNYYGNNAALSSTAVAEDDYVYTPNGTDLDGNIDASAQSNSRGDCWFLTGINTASYSEEGRQAIKDAMTVNSDGSVSITFKGIGVTYTITPEQIEAANNSSAYSSGDDDVLVFEIATEQLRNDIANGNIEFDVTSPYYVSDTTTGETGKTSMDGGFVEQVWYLLTGKLSEHTSDPSKVNDYLNQLEQNPDSTAMSCSFKGGTGDTNGFTVKDANGNDIKLYYSHAYGVKSVDGDTVTIVNPWDSSEEIVLDRDTFCQYANVSYCDLSDTNADKSGFFSKVSDKVTGFIDSIREGAKGVFDTLLDFAGLKDIFEKDIEKSTNKYKFAQSPVIPTSISNYVLSIVEEFRNGNITHSEMIDKIESLNLGDINKIKAQYHI